MAQFCARVRKSSDLPPVTMKDVYQHPTIAALSAARGPRRHRAAETLGRRRPSKSRYRRARLRIALCGSLQLLIFLAYSYFAAFVTALAFGWISAASGLIDTYLRSALCGGALFVGACRCPSSPNGCWSVVGNNSRSRCGVCGTSDSGP